jgi:hypothetical protein
VITRTKTLEARQRLTVNLASEGDARLENAAVSTVVQSDVPIVKTYTVPATGRFNIDVKTMVSELIDSSFGARIDVTNGVPIAVERSMYWNRNGAFWSGDTNALGTPIPQHFQCRSSSIHEWPSPCWQAAPALACPPVDRAPNSSVLSRKTSADQRVPP